MKIRVTTRFFAPQQKQRGSKLPIYLRITIDRKKVEMHTGYWIEESEWDEEKSKSKDNFINSKLAEIEGKLLRIVDQYEQKSLPLSAKLLKNLLNGTQKDNSILWNYAQEFIDRKEKGGEISKETIQKYRHTIDLVFEFLETIGETKETFDIRQVNYAILSKLDDFLICYKSSQGESTIERNTVNKHHSRFRSILIKGFNEGLIPKQPYSTFRLKNKKTTRTFLTLDELTKLESFDLSSNRSLETVRDIFIFSVYTGIRFADAQRLTTKHITKDMEGDFIEFMQSKTGEMVSIPILDPIQKIIDKYNQNPSRIVHGYILPHISNQKVNTYLEIIRGLTGIEKKITHHVARHTFATTVTLSNQIPIEVVSKLLGHTSLKATQVYGKITKNYLKSQMNKVYGT